MNKRWNEGYPDQTRNLNAHKPAVAAMCHYGERYAAQKGGCMDFWDSLPDSEKCICRDMVEKINAAREERPEEM